ncbi:hypothetical protein NC652_009674 [Populus alba x Populus x berolinensis]|nr:hypothetical protein NC652_009674 [Populus alba x Populus x berolinensis]
MSPNNLLITHDHEALAPEYAECGKVSTKTDVYAFGVVLLQLITGLKTTDKILGGIVSARPLLKERNYPDLIDQRILESHDVYQLFWMVRVAEKCLSKDRQKRLTMDKPFHQEDEALQLVDQIMKDHLKAKVQYLIQRWLARYNVKSDD